LTDSNYVDFVGYGTAAQYEGSHSAQSPNQGGSLVRKANSSATATSMTPPSGSDSAAGNGYDTDQNGDDFVLTSPGHPHNLASPAQP
jgi:hypothetical protein